jgi:YD repeat-containing protein
LQHGPDPEDACSPWASSGQTTSYTYDPAGNQLTSQDPNGITTTDTYTPLNQLASVSYSGSSAPSVGYGYDANGNRVSMSDGSGNSSYSYDPFNDLSSFENGAGDTVAYGYNADGQVSGLTYPLGAGATWASSDTVSYSYDDAGELNAVTDFNGNTITIGNTADGLPNSLTLGSTGDTIATGYDATDTPSQITLGNGSTLLQFAYSDLPAGGIATETDTPSWAGSPATYSYDHQHRVTQMAPGTSSALNYAFDASGNLTTLPTGATGSYDNASECPASRKWQGFGLGWLEGRVSLRGFEMRLDRPAAGEGLVGSDRVEELPVGLGVEAEVVAVVDLVPVEVLVLQRAESPLTDAVLAR